MNKALVVAAVMLGFIMVFSIGSTVLIDKVADRVIEKLSKEYSPSPYGPGVDPDRVDVNVFNRAMRQRTQQPQQTVPPPTNGNRPWAE